MLNKSLDNRMVLIQTVVFIALCSIGTAISVRADVLELKDGTVLDGMYMGGSQSSMRFQVNNELQVIPLAKILALTITGRAQTDSSSTAVSSSTPTAQAKPAGLAVGTRLVVKTLESIDTRNNKAGSRFTAKLEGKLMSDGQEIVPAGSKVYGVVVTAKRGGIGSRKPVLELQLTDILINGKLRSITTNLLSGTGEGGGAGSKILKGAAIGGLASGSSGAEDGAKIGLAIAIIGGGRHAGISRGALLEFRLAEPLNL